MGQPAARLLDSTSTGGTIIGPPSTDVFIGKQPAVSAVASTSSPISPYSGVINLGSTSVFINGKPAIRFGDVSSDGSSVIKGELTVLIG